MVHAETSIGLKSLNIIAHLFLLLMVALVSLSWGGENGSRQGCVFVKVLENPQFRDRYRVNITRARFSDQERNYDSEAMYSTIVNASVNSEDGRHLGTLDSFSTGCIACHNGIVSPRETLNFKNNPEGKMQMISGKHPIGMDYAQYAASNKNLRTTGQVIQKLVLVGGRVSCVTCHDPLNAERYHLARNESGRDLCLECHLV